jgi:hypothetical protein
MSVTFLSKKNEAKKQSLTKSNGSKFLRRVCLLKMDFIFSQNSENTQE